MARSFFASVVLPAALAASPAAFAAGRSSRIPAAPNAPPRLAAGVAVPQADPVFAAFMARVKEQPQLAAKAAATAKAAEFRAVIGALTPEELANMPARQIKELADRLWDNSGRSVEGAVAPGVKIDHYIRKRISAARFGDGERQKLLTEAYQFAGRVDRSIIGQHRAAKLLQDRLVQYLENLGNRKKDPIAMHMIGLPGIGKSAMLDHLDQLGISVLRIDAQRYVDTHAHFADDLRSALSDFLQDEKTKGKPVIVVIEEIDKLPEIQPEGMLAFPERTSSMIGTLNQILTDGKLPNDSPSRAPLDLSNVFFVTTMNFAPAEIERFSKEALGKQKPYYDFTTADFARFDRWLRTESSAKYKILSHLFRSNTVSRLAPNAVILRPLDGKDYREIAAGIAGLAVSRSTTGLSASKRLSVTHTRRFVDFLANATVYAPSGARETVYRADALTEQLINYGAKATAKGDRSLDKPRRIELDFDPKASVARVTVTAQILRGRVWSEGRPITLAVRYDGDTGTLIEPDGIATVPPPQVKRQIRQTKAKPLTKKQILEVRFPKTQSAAKGLAAKIDADLKGQGDYSKIIEREMNAYLGRPAAVQKEPPSMVLAGFPGIGKSEIVNLTARHLDLPIIRINMQAFSSDDPKVVATMLDAIENGIAAARSQKNWRGKYIVLLEEMDKVYELNAKGEQVNRPVMSVIKDLLNDGQASLTSRSEWGSITARKLDLRDAFIFGTMNFAVDRFNFKADPRQTSIADVQEAWKILKTRLSDMKNLMGTMFLPETVSRLMSKLHIMAPLGEGDYRDVIELQAQAVIRDRLFDKDGVNKGQISLRLTPAYRRYLFDETVVPSEGPRHTAVSSRIKIAGDLERALKRLKRSSPYANKPITIILDYKPGKPTVVASVVLDERPKDKPIEISRQEVPLFFPSLRARGRIEERRLRVAAHEFGHAYVGVRLGMRFDYATVVPPEKGVGGYVKFNDRSQSAKTMLADVYAGLASRALERMLLSPDPKSPRSVMDITNGPESDIKNLTMMLYNMLYEWGFDPNGGTMDRLGMIGAFRYADFAGLPPDVTERLGRVLRRMEDFVIDDLLAANSMDWYVDKIGEFARAGGTTEEEFYRILGYPYPGKEPVNLGATSLLQKHFKGVVKPPPSQLRAAKAFAQGRTRTTMEQNMDAYTARFLEILRGQSRPKRAARAAKGPPR